MDKPITWTRWPFLPALILLLGLAGLLQATAPRGTAAALPEHASTLATAPESGAESALRIYVSLPRQGANATTSKLIVKGLQAALAERDGRVAGRPLQLVHLNDATGPRWRPKMVRANAWRAIADRRSLAYVGELNSEASAIAEPILASARMTMFAPVSTSPSLTERLASGSKRPVLFRSMPTDADQAEALGIYLKRSGVRRFALVEDGALYGQGLAATVAAVARDHGIRMVAHRRANRNGKRLNALAKGLARHAPQAVLFSGSLSSAPAALFRALNREMPRALLFGGDALAHGAFARRLSPALQRRVRLTAPRAKTPRHRAVALGLGRSPDPVTVFAYEGMRALLAAIERSGAAAMAPAGDIFDLREAVRSAVFDGHRNRGLIGPWRIESNGDSSNRAFSAIRLRGNRLVDRGRLVAPAPPR